MSGQARWARRAGAALLGLAAELGREDAWGRVLAHAGEALRRAGRTRDALRLFDKALGCNPNDAMARHFRDWARAANR